MKHLAGIFLILGLCLTGATVNAQAESRLYRVQAANVSLEQAIKKVRRKYKAKVLSASEIRSKGPLVYRVKILLPNGRVRTVFVDGETGEVFEA